MSLISVCSEAWRSIPEDRRERIIIDAGVALALLGFVAVVYAFGLFG